MENDKDGPDFLPNAVEAITKQKYDALVEAFKFLTKEGKHNTIYTGKKALAALDVKVGE